MVVIGMTCRPRDTGWIKARVLAFARLKVSAAALLVLATSLLATAPAQAAPGDLDASFSGDGKQTTDFAGGEAASDVALQADGKIVAVGSAGDGFAVARYNADGALDIGFSGDGRDTIGFAADSAEARGVVIQADGRIVVVGSTASYEGDALGPGNFALARYNPDGTLDATFSGDGQQTTDFGGDEHASSVALQADGKIVVVGGADWDFALARYNADGSLDTTFSGDGKHTTDFGGSEDAGGVALQNDGRIVAVGRDGGWDFAVARYMPEGTLDASFSGDGRQTTDFGSGGDYARAVALQADGAIVAVGRTISGFGFDFALARYSSDGSLDATFSGDGKQTTDFGGYEAASDVALQPDGKIVLVGGNERDFALTRYEPDGSLDTSFGKRTTDFGSSTDGAAGLALQADGKILAVGKTGDGSANVVGGGFALARYEGGSGTAEPATPPTNLSAPGISGSPIEGQALTATAGAWSSGTPIALEYQWRRCDSTGGNCVDIAAAALATYTLTAADVGHAVRVRETATNAYGIGSADSPTTGVVAARPGAIVGTVRNARTGVAIAGAVVNCGTGHSAATTGSGAYTITSVAPGSYRCAASANRYRPATKRVTVASGQTTTADFRLTRR
jgi:uncharacterized delta-60 repeat protein